MKNIWKRLTAGLAVRFLKRPLCGRVSRVSVIRGGELSVVVRFGIEEIDEARKHLAPGTLVSLSIGVIDHKTE